MNNKLNINHTYQYYLIINHCIIVHRISQHNTDPTPIERGYRKLSEYLWLKLFERCCDVAQCSFSTDCPIPKTGFAIICDNRLCKDFRLGNPALKPPHRVLISSYKESVNLFHNFDLAVLSQMSYHMSEQFAMYFIRALNMILSSLVVELFTEKYTSRCTQYDIFCSK